tara:strand:+ start:75 stop:371 length:297 start_codon:yes stop_codon:yes gene_type:complete
MDTLNSDLNSLENLSKKISDLIYNNQFTQIAHLDEQRKLLIEKIKKNEINKNDIKNRISKIVENNTEMVKATENKLQLLIKHHSEHNKRLKAYSSIKY